MVAVRTGLMPSPTRGFAVAEGRTVAEGPAAAPGMSASPGTRETAMASPAAGDLEHPQLEPATYGLEVDPQPSTPYHSVRSSLLR
jgi:hypothetical protein